MKTIEVQLFGIEELNETAKERAINWYRANFLNHDHIYDEAYNSVKAFHKIFPTEEGSHSWFEFRADWSAEIDELQGLRLRKWIINNVLRI